MKQTSDRQALCEEIVRDYERRRRERRALELQWRLNMDFYNGKQYAEITPLGDVEEYGKQFCWQEREAYNHIASIVETRLSKLSRTKTGVSVRPSGNDERDVQTAKFATRLIRAVADEQNLTRLMNRAAAWSEVTGTCFFRIGWDADKGRVVGQGARGETVREGDLAISVVPPFEIYPDRLSYDTLSECRSILHVKAYRVDEIRQIWGADVEGEDLRALDGYGVPTDPDDDAPREYCTVIERYRRPSKDMPDGELCVVAGGKLLYRGILPYVNDADGRRGYPFVKIHCIDRVGCLFGTSVVERMIPLQRAYNAVKNRKHELLNRLAAGVLAVEDGSVDTDNLEDEGLAPGKILVYRQGSNPPAMLDSGRVPPDLRSEEDRILSEFITISGVSELSKYSQTYSSMSGRAISLLVEQDDTRLAIASNSVREAYMELCKHAIRLYKQFATHPRLARIAGENGEIELRSFCASDLESEDLVFDSENELSDTLASRRSMALELIGMGILQDADGKVGERNKLKILELLGFGNWESARDVDECHRRAAMRENMQTDRELCVQSIDHHAIHIDEHTKAVLSDQLSERAREKLKAHIRDHQTAQTMQAQIQAVGAQGGNAYAG